MTFSYDHNQSLGYLTGIASRLLSNMLATRLKAAGIEMTSEQWGAIIILLNDGAMSQGQLGEKLNLEKSSVSRLTDGLEKRGWIVRSKDPNDSRQRLVEPTPKALDTAEHCATIARAIHKEAQLGMTESERLVARSLLSRIIMNLKGTPNRE
ncbi:MAG: MarR family winged helix-turn-helix transcriptional regulator [Desulfuromonadales bacterium]